MRILTVRALYAWAIISGGKDVENRSRNIAGDYRGPVAIHASANPRITDGGPLERLDAVARLDALATTRRPSAPHYGAILGVVDLVDVHSCSDSGGCVDTNARVHMRREFCSPWAMPGHRHLVLANPRDIAEPIPYRGALGLRKLDEETTARILEQIGTNQ